MEGKANEEKETNMGSESGCLETRSANSLRQMLEEGFLRKVEKERKMAENRP